MSTVITLLCLASLLCVANGCDVVIGGLGRVNPHGEVKEPVGSSLRLECVLNKNAKEVQPGYSEHLSWKKNGKDIAKEMIKVVDNYTAELLMPNVTVADSGVYMCFFQPNGSRPRYVCHNDVKIGYPPMNVTDFSCISRNWQYLLCTFTNPPNPIISTYKLSQVQRSFVTECNLTKKYEKLSKVRQHSCNITSHSKPPYLQSAKKYYFRLEAKNDLGTNMLNFEIDHFARVLPNVPKNLTVTNESSTVLRCGWQPPSGMGSFPPGLQYLLYYRSQWDPPSVWQTIQTSANYTLTGLQPYTEYSFKLKCRSAVTTDEDMWSKMTDILTVRTLPDAPARPPNVTAGSFQVRNALNSRVVHIFWQMIPNYENNGRNFTYMVTATPAESSVKGHVILPENKTNNYAVFTKLNLTISYLFTISSANEVGRSDASFISVETDLELPDVPERFTVIDYDHGLFELSWIAPNSKFQDVTHYTLFWCNNIKPHPFTCTGNISWIVVDRNITAHNITLLDKQQYYQFAIAANTPTSSSGMVWATCSVPYNGTLNKIKKVKLIKTGSTELKVQWKLDCSERIGIVKGFKVFYCETSSCNSPCSGTLKMKYAEGSHIEEYELVQLQPYTYYKVTVSAETRAGAGEQSEGLYEQTDESEPPQAYSSLIVKEATNDSITFQWTAPVPTHGLIKWYKIEYNGKIKEIEVDPLQKNHTATLRLLEPFTNYTIRLQACVQQSKCSPKSDALKITTALGAPGRMGRPQITQTNSTHVLVTFENPAHPNGHLDYYNVMMMWENNDGINTSTVITVTSTDNTLELHCEDPEGPKAYSFTVQAVNIVENETLFGPYSDIQEFPCWIDGDKGVAPGVIAGVVGAAVAITMLVVLIVYCYMRFRQKFREIQNIKIYLPRGLEPENPKSPGDFTSFIPPPHKHPPINSKDLFNHLNSHSNGSPRSRNTSGDTRVSASSMDELLQNNGDNKTDVSADSGSAMGSVSSAKTTRSNLSSDSGNDVDSLPPTTPDMVFLDNPMVAASVVPKVPPTIHEKTPESSTPSPYSKFARYSNPPAQLDHDGYLPTVGCASVADESGYVLPSARDHSDELSVLPYSQVGLAADVGYVNVPNEADAVQGLRNDLNAVVPLAPEYSRVGLSDAANGEVHETQPLTGYSAIGLGNNVLPPRSAVNGYVTAAMAGDLYGTERSNDSLPALLVQAAPRSPCHSKELPGSKRASATTMDSPLPESYSRLSFHDPALDNGYVSLPGSDQQQQQQPTSSSTVDKLSVLRDELNQDPSTSKSYSPSNAGSDKLPGVISKNGYVSLNVANDSDASSPTFSIPHDVMKSSQTSDEFSSPGPYSRVVSMSFDDSDSLPSPKDGKS